MTALKFALCLVASLPGVFSQPLLHERNQENVPIQEEFRVEKGLRVEIVDASGMPVAAATVSLFAVYQEEAAERLPWKQPDREKQETREAQEKDDTKSCSDWRKAAAVELTDERGQVKFELERPGAFCLSAELIGFVPVRVGPFEIDSFDLPRRSVMTPLRIVLPASIQSRGLWLPAHEDGIFFPAKGVRVSFRSGPDGLDNPVAKTDRGALRGDFRMTTGPFPRRDQ